MEKINILLLEDKDTEITSFLETAVRLKEELDVEFIFTTHKALYGNEEKLYKDLLFNNFDFFIVDLCLDWDIDWEEWGNTFLKSIFENFHTPIIINSADLSVLNSELQSLDSLLVKQFNSNESSTEEILKVIFTLYQTGITKVIWKEGKIHNTLNKLIWDWGLNNIEKWSEFDNAEKSEKSLSRYILSHLHHELSWDYEDFHPEEIYLKVLWSWKYDTWTILEKDWNFYIILTPACDIANCNTDYYLVSKISDIITWENKDIDITKLTENMSKLSDPSCNTDCKKKITEKIEKALKRMKSDDTKKSKFLPMSTLFKWWYINFEKLEKISISEKSDYNIVCYISSHFLKDIISDFWYYYSRQGQPNLNSDIIIKNLLSASE